MSGRKSRFKERIADYLDKQLSLQRKGLTDEQVSVLEIGNQLIADMYVTVSRISQLSNAITKDVKHKPTVSGDVSKMGLSAAASYYRDET